MSESPTSSRRPSAALPEHRPISADFSIASSARQSSGSSDDMAGDSIYQSNPAGLTVDGGRPPLNTVNSSTGLLAPEAETPFTKDPFSGRSPTSPTTPLDSSNGGSLSSASGMSDNPNEAVIAPRIQVNSSSIPSTPVANPAPSFETPPAFSAPFASSHDASPTTVLTHRRSSVAPSATSAANNYGATRDHETAEADIKRASGGSALSEKKDFANRRSLRMKAAKPTKKDRESREYKPAGPGIRRKPFESTRLKGEIYKPWLEKKDPAQRWARWITIGSIIIGFGLAAFLCYNGYAAVPNLGATCLILDDKFDTLNTDTWEREVRLDGYGHGSFQWTTASDNNSYVDNGILYIVPTLTSDHLGVDAISNGYTLNLTLDGTCTSTNVSQCAAVSNSSRLTVINPVQSARLITKKSVNIKYGKVEVRAKFPTGDWLWPSISMLPVENTYGAWPRSGQIDILTGRGNNASYPNRGVDYAQSDIHWGPTSDLDRMWMTWGYREQRRTYYNQQWHTYGLEWNDKYMWTYIDSKVSQVISLRFNKQSFWSKGKFPSTITNSTTGDLIKLINPWLSSENNVAPFDQEFYLVLDLSVGATDSWFPDGEGGKPWIDNSGTEMYDFWNAKDKWWNEWPSDAKERGFAIDSVKVWKTGSC